MGLHNLRELRLLSLLQRRGAVAPAYRTSTYRYASAPETGLSNLRHLRPFSSLLRRGSSYPYPSSGAQIAYGRTKITHLDIAPYGFRSYSSEKFPGYTQLWSAPSKWVKKHWDKASTPPKRKGVCICMYLQRKRCLDA